MFGLDRQVARKVSQWRTLAPIARSSDAVAAKPASHARRAGLTQAW